MGTRPAGASGAGESAAEAGMARDGAERPAAEVSIDLRSDTVTRPGAEMRAAMAAAPVGDDVYGEDPTVSALEEETAELLGLEAGLFCPTGSMANMLGIAALTPAGTEVLAESRAHILRAESGGHGALAGITSRTWRSDGGVFRAADALDMLSPPGSPMLVPTATVSVENTHNFWGGTVADLGELRKLRAATAQQGVAVHLDGARLANAWTAAGVAPSVYGEVADTISICLSKGLGAPVGSVLAGSAETIAAARTLRKRYGGGMRQAGIIAAGGLFALRHNADRLADDHAHARLIAEAIASAAPGAVDPAAVATNIVVIELGQRWSAGGAQAFARDAERHGVRVSVLGPHTVRLVTHLDVSREQAQYAAEALAGLAAR
ncbi:beta-eliminating lyase-related protein [Brevibacterium sp. BRM-1]|uniref:threonine aldolase family protein n=1 Tax=Brevibacterium sp. BRM-1 TaxID=2999062 RepID=UPI002280D7D3|nr:GntG family PLP-dependent aldolase [Brevibacterium sp. BRM-1]WAL41102.1 beta-eliminating lyase-related protein [Brevibacterium sp. BRM-1]